MVILTKYTIIPILPVVFQAQYVCCSWVLGKGFQFFSVWSQNFPAGGVLLMGILDVFKYVILGSPKE